MLIEMHCHTVEHSACSSVPAVELIRRVLVEAERELLLFERLG